MIDELEHGQLNLPKMPPPGHPLVACLACENKAFRFRPGNKDMPSMQACQRFYEDMTSVIGSSFAFKFTVLQMPVAVLHSVLGYALFEHIYHLLFNMEQSVALHILSLQDYGIHQDRQILALIASPYPGLGAVGLMPEPNPSADSSTLHELLRGLAISNARPSYLANNQSSMAMCLSDVGEGSDSAKHNVYNHNTDRAAPPNPEDRVIVDIDSSDAISLCCHSTRPLVHKSQSQHLFTCSHLNFPD